LLQILDLATETLLLLLKSQIPLEIMVGEALVEFVEDELGFGIHDAQSVLAVGEVVVGKWIGMVQAAYSPQIAREWKGITATSDPNSSSLRGSKSSRPDPVLKQSMGCE